MTEQPPSNVAALAAAYTCGHCNSNPAELAQDQYGLWHLTIAHDEGCPVITGAVSNIPDTFRAIQEAL